MSYIDKKIQFGPQLHVWCTNMTLDKSRFIIKNLKTEHIIGFNRYTSSRNEYLYNDASISGSPIVF